MDEFYVIFGVILLFVFFLQLCFVNDFLTNRCI